MKYRERDTTPAGSRDAATPGAQPPGGPGKTTLTQALAPDASTALSGGRTPWLGGTPAMPPRAGTAAGGGAPAQGFGAGGSGDALPYRRDMEAAFGEDFSGVRVRVGQRAALASIDAHAAASGDELSFADTQPDRRTVAHELAHVVQHRRHGAGSGGISRPGDAAEREADAIADAVEAGGPAPSVHHPAVTTTSSQPDRVRQVGLDGTGGAAASDETQALPATAASQQRSHGDRDMPGSQPAAPGKAMPAVAGSVADGSPMSVASTSGSPTAASPTAASPTAASPPTASPTASPTAASPTASPTAASPAPAHRPPAPGGAPAGGPQAGGHPAGIAHGAIATLPGASHAITALHGARLSELDVRTRQAVAGAVASHEAVQLGSPPPPAAREAETIPAAPVAPRADRAAARPVKKMDHHAGAHEPPRDRISAGPRPRVALDGSADPRHADTAARAGLGQLDARLAAAHQHSAADHGVSRLFAPVPRPPPPAAAPRPPASITAPAIPAAPWQALPPTPRARLDQVVAPALDRRTARLAADTDRDTQDTATALAALQTAHDQQAAARHDRTRAQIAALRTGGATYVTAIRGQWQRQGQAVRDQVTADVHGSHAAMESDVQATVHEGEARGNTILTGAETSANARQAAADARAAQIRASAEARAAAARASSPVATMPIARQALVDPGGGGGAAGEETSRQILEDAQAEIDAEIARAKQEIQTLIDSAGAVSKEEIVRRELAITARIEALRVEIDIKIASALNGKFPRMEAEYIGQINTLLGDVSTQVVHVGGDLLRGDTAAIARDWADGSALLDRRAGRLKGTLEDAAVLSTFADSNTDTASALEAFGITPDGWKQNGDNEQDMLAEAIRIENAFRAADKSGLLKDAGLTAPGAAFKMLMNEGDGVTLSYVGTDGGNSGAETKGAGQVDFYSVTRDHDDGIANGTRFHFGHELGHVFNASMANSKTTSGDSTLAPYTFNGKGALDTETIMASGTAIAGKGVTRFVPTADDLKGITRDPARLAALQDKYAAQGMRTGTQAQSTDYNEMLRDMPYQQHLNASAKGEWFADIFVNWANGTLTDNAQGDAIDDWMNDHAQDWVQMGLDAKAVKDKAAAEKAKKQNGS
jgi:hypothetical protein